MIGCSKEVAEQLLIAAELELGTVKEVNSSLEAGMVITQSVEKDKKVPIGSKINIEISNGIPEENSFDVTVNLPNINKTGILKIYVNSELYFTSNELLLDGAQKVYNIKGTDAETTFTVTIDDCTVQKGKIDFTQVPAVVSEEEILPYEQKESLIDVVNKTKTDAINQLNAAGFYNIDFVEESNDSIVAGNVISQSPVSDSVSKIPTSTKIILTISTGPAEESVDTAG